MKPLLRLAGLGALALAAAACDQEKKPAQPAAAAAGNAIQPPSVSDDMLPYDTVRSQPPLAPDAGPSDRPAYQPGDPGVPASEAARPDAGESRSGASPSPAPTPRPAAKPASKPTPAPTPSGKPSAKASAKPAAP